MSDRPSRTVWRSAIATVKARFRLIWLAPVLAVLALGFWVFASPVGSAPDDDFHLTSTWCANGLRTDLCQPGPTAAERVVPPAVLYAPCYAQDPKVSAACYQKYLDEGSAPKVVTGRGSFSHNYPPVFYAFMNLFVGHDIVASALLIRFVNVLLLVGLTTALYCLLPKRRRNSLIWGWLITLVPLGLFLIASNNPSSWAIIGIGSTWLALLGFLETTGRRKIALGGIYAATTLMAAARGDSALYAVIAAAIVVLLTASRSKAYLLQLVLPAVMSLISVLFFFSSQQSAVASTGLGSGSAVSRPLDSFGILAYNLLNVQAIWAGAFGGWGLGWLDTTLPAIVSVGALAVFVAVAFVGIGIHDWRKTASVVFLSLVVWLLPTYVLVRGGNVVGENVQPRYLLPLIVLMGGLVVLGIGAREIRFSFFQSAWIVLTLGIAESIAMYVNLRRYLTGVGVQGINLDANREWWWSGFAIPPMAFWLLGSLTFTGLVFVLVRDRLLAARTQDAALVEGAPIAVQP